MAWTPSIAVLTPRAIADNLLDWILDDTRQSDALEYFGGNGLKALKTVGMFLEDKTKPVYPLIAYSDDNDLQEYGDNLIHGGYSVTFSIGVQNSDQDEATEQARVYDAAIKSLIRNISHADLITGTRTSLVTFQRFEGGFEVIKANDARNDFLQEFKIKAVYELIGNSHI